MHLLRTRVNKGKTKGRSPDVEPRPSLVRLTPRDYPLMDCERPTLGLVVR
jgi:hypothetical protein